MDSLKSVFGHIAKDTRIDAKLLERIHAFERAFVNRNEDHIAFFGGNLTGVHRLRFRPADRDAWFNDVLEVDEIMLEDAISDLRHKDPYWRRVFEEDWKRAKDAVNLSCVWLLYAIQHSTHLSPRQKEQGSEDVLLIMQYKFLSSLMVKYFPFAVDTGLAQATYAGMNMKYALKRAGSWGALLRSRSKDLMAPKSIHRNAYMTFQNPADVVYMINDTQGRLRDLIKQIWKIMDMLKTKGVRIGSEKAFSEIDGDTVIKDKTRQYTSYIRYVHDVIGDRNSFVRAELIQVVSDAMHTMPPQHLQEALEWMSLNHRVRGQEGIEVLIDETLIFAFNQMSANKQRFGGKTAISDLMVKLRSLYMASRMADPTLLKGKELAEGIVQKSIKSRNPSVIASVRTGVQLYIVLRALAMQYYQK